MCCKSWYWRRHSGDWAAYSQECQYARCPCPHQVIMAIQLRFHGAKAWRTWLNWPIDELWTHLGLHINKQLPFFNRFTDPDAILEPWTEEGKKWLTSESSNHKPLQSCWHLLVEIYHMLQHTFKGKLVLLMNGAGISKIFQVIEFIAWLSHFHWHYQAHKKFPGLFNMCSHTQLS